MNDQKIAVVTGASTGIGRAAAIELSRSGFAIFLVARSADKLNETKKIIEENGGQAQVFICDLSDLNSVNNLINTIKQTTSRIDLIANIAGIWHGDNEVYADKDFHEFEQKIIVDTLNVGVLSPMLMVHGMLPLMPAGGKIINLSGTFENGAKGWLPYFVSKRAIEDLTVGLAQELQDKNIQVNCISPSDTATPAYAKYFSQYLEDAVEPLEIARKFVELADRENKTTGQVFVIRKDNEPVEGFHS